MNLGRTVGLLSAISCDQKILKEFPRVVTNTVSSKHFFPSEPWRSVIDNTGLVYKYFFFYGKQFPAHVKQARRMQ